MEADVPSVVHFEAYTSAERAGLYVMAMPNLDDIEVHEISLLGVAGEVFADAGQKSNSAVDSGSTASLSAKASTMGMAQCYGAAGISASGRKRPTKPNAPRTANLRVSIHTDSRRS